MSNDNRLESVSRRQVGYLVRDTLSVTLLALGLVLAITAVAGAFAATGSELMALLR